VTGASNKEIEPTRFARGSSLTRSTDDGGGVTSKRRASDGLVISYLVLRRAVGIIGIALPFVLVVGKWLLNGWGIQSSISAYYYTSMRDVFVGSLCAIGVFLLSYRGYERADDVAGNVACVFAVGVALFPTSPPAGATATQTAVGLIHLVFASAFFLTLAYFSLVLFRKTNPAKQMSERKKERNVVYTACGYTILACVGLIIVDVVLLRDLVLQAVGPVFWLESAAVIAFGVSWLTKGETILADVVSSPQAPRPDVSRVEQR
jgi:hypothetical protein